MRRSPKRTWPARARVALCAGAALAGVAAAPLVAQTGQADDAATDGPPIEGVFLLDSAAGDPVADVIDRGVGLLPWYKRPFARGRLREATRPAAWVSIEPGADTLRIRTEVDDLRIPWEGGIEDWEWKPEDYVDVTASWDGDDLLQDFRGSDGSRNNRYVLSEDGRQLELRVRIESEQLTEPLRYRLVYVRQD